MRSLQDTQLCTLWRKRAARRQGGWWPQTDRGGEKQATSILLRITVGSFRPSICQAIIHATCADTVSKGVRGKGPWDEAEKGSTSCMPGRLPCLTSILPVSPLCSALLSLQRRWGPIGGDQSRVLLLPSYHYSQATQGHAYFLTKPWVAFAPLGSAPGDAPDFRLTCVRLVQLTLY